MDPRSVQFSSIAQIGALYRSGKLSPVELTRFSLSMIEALNPVLNAFITVTGELALAEARTAELELRTGKDRGPLHGIPIAVKDLIDMAGVRTTSGSRILSDYVPYQDAGLISKLRACGAVILGKTNMSEFAMGVPHPDFGPVHNPWDTSRTAGASSGGSAAAVAAGLCYGAIGTDTGGSIRIPASYCGLAGFKPTHGLVNLKGVFPLSPTLDHAGPLARSCQDAAIILRGLTGEGSNHWEVPDLSGKRFGILTYPELLSSEVETAFEFACEALRKAGAILVKFNLWRRSEIDPALFHTLLPEAAAVHADEMLTRPQDYAPMTLQQLKLGLPIPATAYVQAQLYREDLRIACAEALSRVDALISPTVPFLPPSRDPMWHSPEGEIEGCFTVPHNLTGFPALSICAGWMGALPIGLQIVTQPYTDLACLSLGAACEATFQVHRHPEGMGE